MTIITEQFVSAEVLISKSANKDFRVCDSWMLAHRFPTNSDEVVHIHHWQRSKWFSVLWVVPSRTLPLAWLLNLIFNQSRVGVSVDVGIGVVVVVVVGNYHLHYYHYIHYTIIFPFVSQQSPMHPIENTKVAMSTFISLKESLVRG